LSLWSCKRMSDELNEGGACAVRVELDKNEKKTSKNPQILMRTKIL
jgi:hypothetical protein